MSKSVLKIIKKIYSSKFVKLVTGYGISNILNALIPFFLLPVLTNYLSPTDYGIVTICFLLISFITPIIGLGAQSTITKRYFEKGEYVYEKYLNNIFWLIAMSSAFCLILTWPFNIYLEVYLPFRREWIWVVVFIAFATNINQVLLIHLQITYNVKQYISIQFGQSLIFFISSIACIVFLNYKWEGRVVGQVIGVSSILITSGIYFSKANIYYYKLDIKYVKKILIVGLPTVVHSVISLALTMSDRIILSGLVGEYETGIYSVGQQLGSSIYLVTSAFNSAFVPWLFEKLNEDSRHRKNKIVLFSYLYFISIALLGVVFYAVIYFVFPLIVGSKFLHSFQYVPYILSSYVFLGMYTMITNYFFYAEKTYLLSIVTSIAAFANVVLCYLLVHKLGTKGAAISSMISSCLFFLLAWYLSNKAYPMPWFLNREMIQNTLKTPFF